MKQRLSMRSGMRTSTKVIIVTSSCILISLGFFLFFNLGNSEKSKANTNITAIASGNWSNPAIWSSGTVPGASDNVTISPSGSNITVTVTGTASCASLVITANTRSATLSISDGETLTVAGDVTLNGGSSSARIAQLNVQGNSLLTDGTLTVNGNININGSGTSSNAVLSILGAGTVNLRGQVNLPAAPANYGSISSSASGNFNFSGTALQTLKLTAAGATDIAYGNVLVNNTAGVQLEANVTSSKVKGDLEIQSGKLLSGGYSIALAAGKAFEIANGATYTTTTTGSSAGIPMGSASHQFGVSSNIEFAGAAQTIPALLSSQSYGNIIVSAAGTKSLAANITVSSGLLISAGSLDLNGYTLTVNSSSTTAIQRTGGGIISERTDNSSVVSWKIATSTGSYTIPFVTAAGSYIPVTFNVTAAGLGVSGYMKFATYPTAADNTPYPVSPSAVAHVNANGLNNSADVADRFWSIDNTGYITRPTASITFSATAVEVGTISDLVAQRWNTTTNAWDAAIAGQTASATGTTVPGVSSFGIWAIVEKLKPLPVELIAFDAKRAGSTVNLTWATGSEINNNYFSIERSADGKAFSEIGRKKGTNGSSRVNYAYSDPMPGEAYYRLRQTDFNGTYTYSPVIMVKSDGAASAEQLVIDRLYPNPFSEKLSVNFTTRSSGIVDVELHDMNGKLVYRESKDFDEGSNSYNLKEDVSITKGVYFLVFRHNNKVTTRKIIKI